MERGLTAIFAAAVLGRMRLLEQDKPGTPVALKEGLNDSPAPHRDRIVE
jgi:hypothetical protein